jgi:phosphoenolpyruvate carboxykinase (ATP)
LIVEDSFHILLHFFHLLLQPSPLLNLVTTVKMLASNVNKTSIHPYGVKPHTEPHTEIEEELYEKAHIDYERVDIVANASVATLYEDALVRESGTAITSSGALSAYSGAKTGRSPLDKRIVQEPTSENDIW